jgi:hypothetical protein
VYRIFRQIESGELVHVALRDRLEQAAELVASLNATWPGEYIVQDSETPDRDLPILDPS